MVQDKYITFIEFYKKIKDSKDPVKVIKEHPELFGKIGILRTIYLLEEYINN